MSIRTTSLRIWSGGTFPGILSAAWCFPTGRTRKTKPFCRSCVRAGPRFGRCRMKIGKRHTFVLQKDILLHTACTPHTGSMFENASCNLLLFSLLGRNILLLSDCDDRNPQVYQWLKEIPIDLVLLNPFFFASASGQQCLKRFIQPKKSGDIPRAGGIHR